MTRHANGLDTAMARHDAEVTAEERRCELLAAVEAEVREEFARNSDKAARRIVDDVFGGTDLGHEVIALALDERFREAGEMLLGVARAHLECKIKWDAKMRYWRRTEGAKDRTSGVD